MTTSLELRATEPALDLRTQVEPEDFPYVYRMAGSPTQSLGGWQQLSDVLHLIALDTEYCFLTVDRTDGCGRWAQVLGHPHELIVEVGLPDGPMRVSRLDDSPEPYRVISSVNTVVDARRADLFTAAEAVVLIWAWLENAVLGFDGLSLRTPDDWK
ncbi:MAG: hypothetical protein RJQ01_04490 [Microcella sp.]|uniref:hypothetical protein n=1 Tax=Microcella sp. TaxID=1913979 RepID=UPI0033149DC2